MRIRVSSWLVTMLVAASAIGLWTAPAARAEAPGVAPWEAQNPVKPLPAEPLGVTGKLLALPNPPTPETVRLGRWLYFDKRLSADGTLSCASCHKPENAFSETTPVSTGIRGQKGGRKAPSFVNQAWTLAPVFFWDGRAASLEDQALGPVANPIEMGNTHEAMLATLKGVKGYPGYFQEAFGRPEHHQGGSPRRSPTTSAPG
ncbi:MAG: cytochrome-c peroxidase [Deltaproteobacteria bacterium]|nr:cytochrome-c peroxidase [Deltaproteobacteria bacterium]